MLLDSVKTLSEQVCGVLKDKGECTLEHISNLVEAFTKIDRIEYLGYNCSSTNPIWGSFRRYETLRQYSSPETRVEVMYANHLPIYWKRFVVAKELCHSLEADKGSHTVTNVEVRTLITALAYVSVGSTPENPNQALNMEKLAEVGAIEILLPLRIREALLTEGEMTTGRISEISRTYVAPESYVGMAFRDDYMQLSRKMFGPG